MKNLTLSELVRALWRRRLWFAVPAVLGLAAGIVAMDLAPPVYRASTLVLVEPQKVPHDYVKSTVTTGLDDRLDTIQQQILNRTNLERIIEEIGLYPELRRERPMEEVVARVRDKLWVNVHGNAFRVYFEGVLPPEKVALTANRVAELFIEQNLKLREKQAQGTSAFLENELDATQQRLEEQEARIATFKRAYMGQLPEQKDTILRSIEQLQSKLQLNVDAVDKAEMRKILLRGRMADLSYSSSLGSGRLGPAAPAKPSRLQEAREELAAARTRYTDRHPDVIRLEAEIARLEVLERERAERIEVSEAAPIPETAPVDPSLKAELAAIDLEVRGLLQDRERILAQVGLYQQRLDNIPQVEQQLISLSRDYENIKGSYDSLMSKRLDARLSENLERRQQSEQFRILERAMPPASPQPQQKLLMLALGIGVGCLAGLFAALLREKLDPTYTDADSFQQAFPGVPVLATIPLFQAGGEPASNQGRRV